MADAFTFLPVLQPLGRNACERVLNYNPLGRLRSFPLSHRVGRRGEESPPVSVPLTGKGEAHGRILAKGYELFFAFEAIRPAPQLASRGRDPEIQTTAITKDSKDYPSASIS